MTVTSQENPSHSLRYAFPNGVLLSSLRWANGKTRTGRLWTYVRDDRPAALSNARAVWFAYSEDRRGEHPQQHLKHFTGALQADAYSGLHHLYGDGRIYEVGCWAHARRKFYDIHVTHQSPTTTEDLRRWMEKMLRSLSTKSDTAAAIRYTLSHWRALTRYVDDGLPEIDNSAAERALRAVAIGRKNYLFFGSDSGGERAAAFYAWIGTAKLNGMDPAFYLRTASPASLSTPSTASPTCCPGTCQPHSKPLEPPKTQIGVHLK